MEIFERRKDKVDITDRGLGAKAPTAGGLGFRGTAPNCMRSRGGATRSFLLNSEKKFLLGAVFLLFCDFLNLFAFKVA